MSFLSSTILPSLLGLSLIACVANSSTDEETMGPDELIALGGKADLSIPSGELCNLVCDYLRAPEDSCFGQDACHSFCDEHADAAVQGDAWPAYIDCAADSPLCFRTMESCIWTGLDQGLISQNFSVQGKDFPAYYLYDVHALVKDDTDTITKVSGSVAEGQFSLQFENQELYTPSATVLYYVDTNLDGVCTPGVDWSGVSTISIDSEWFGPGDATILGTSPHNNNDSWVCDQF